MVSRLRVVLVGLHDGPRRHGGRGGLRLAHLGEGRSASHLVTPRARRRGCGGLVRPEGGMPVARRRRDVVQVHKVLEGPRDGVHPLLAHGYQRAGGAGRGVGDRRLGGRGIVGAEDLVRDGIERRATRRGNTCWNRT